MKTILNYDEFVNESNHNYSNEQQYYREIGISEENIDNTLNNDTEYSIQAEEMNESKLQDEYREFFKHVLDLYEVKSPASIKDEDCKKEFFNKIQKGWIKGEGLSEYGKRLMDCECLDENGECCEKDDE